MLGRIDFICEVCEVQFWEADAHACGPFSKHVLGMVVRILNKEFQVVVSTITFANMSFTWSRQLARSSCKD